jgi:hypothetical protein
VWIGSLFFHSQGSTRYDGIESISYQLSGTPKYQLVVMIAFIINKG